MSEFLPGNTFIPILFQYPANVTGLKKHILFDPGYDCGSYKERSFPQNKPTDCRSILYDPDYSKLAASTNVSFRFTYYAQFDGSSTEIIFSDEVERDIVFDEPEPGQVYVSKDAQYDETSGRFTYTIKVTATGDVTNVNVRDVISGNALKYNEDLSVEGSSNFTNNGGGNGFDLTFDSMAEGQEITITYSANVDFLQDTDGDGQFTFELKDADGNVLDTKTNAADGTVTFDPIEYTQDSIYITDETGAYTGEVRNLYGYTISEVIPEGATDNGDGTFTLEGYTYDGTVYSITVILTDNGDGTITAVDGASVSETPPAEGTEEESSYVFTNAYAASGTLKLDAEKTFTNGVLQGGDFTFELKDVDGNVLQSKKNDADGKISFDMIAYTMADVAKSPYIYTVSEVIADKKDVKYDHTVYTVTVSLKDKGNGELEVTKEIDNGGELKFVNEQLNIETYIELGGIKIVKLTWINPRASICGSRRRAALGGRTNAPADTPSA